MVVTTPLSGMIVLDLLTDGGELPILGYQILLVKILLFLNWTISEMLDVIIEEREERKREDCYSRRKGGKKTLNLTELLFFPLLSLLSSFPNSQISGKLLPFNVNL